jgi:hypothetical protein
MKLTTLALFPTLLLLLLAPPQGDTDTKPNVADLGRLLYAATNEAPYDIIGLSNASEVKRIVKQEGCESLEYRFFRLSSAPSYLYAIGASMKAGELVVGRHFRFKILNNTAEYEHPSSTSCLFLDTPTENTAGLTVQHFLSLEPTEFHVLVSLLAGVPVYVDADPNIWKVDGTTITLLDGPGT